MSTLNKQCVEKKKKKKKKKKKNITYRHLRPDLAP